MPDLFHTLNEQDLGFLKIIAEAWGLDLDAPDAEQALPVLISGMSNRLLAQEIIETLPDAARQAVHALLNNEGKLPWSLFCRRFGEVRSFGAAKRDRERPDLSPVSPAEALWYRGLIGRAFLNLPPEPQEFAYIPNDLITLLSPLKHEGIQPYGRPAASDGYAKLDPASLRILDDTCTLLAALRSDLPIKVVESRMLEIPAHVLTGLCRASGLINEEAQPDLEKLKTFLEAAPLEALKILVEAWKTSVSFNDLRYLPDLVFEGEWQNHPLQTRTRVLTFLEDLPGDQWWDLEAFIQAVYERQPDFQRPAGDYDSWFIRRADSETYLRGFTSWDAVDGALLRFLICGPLHWLGMVDLAAPQPGTEPAAFRPSAISGLLWESRPVTEPKTGSGTLKIDRDGHIRISRHLPRAMRYQISRFCDWDQYQKGTYHYQITPASLERAAKQDLKPEHLLAMLKRIPDVLIPPSLVKALKRWQQHGTQAYSEAATLLRLQSPEVLTALQNSPAARHISEVLTPTTAVIKPGKLEKVQSALMELGYLVD